MTSHFYAEPYEEVDKNPDGADTKERKEMKAAWLATLDGMSNVSPAEMRGVSKDEADKPPRDLFESRRKLSAWIERTKTFAQRYGYVWMDKKQRKRRLPEATKSKYDIPYGKYNEPEYEKERLHSSSVNRALRQAPNAVVHGSSAIQRKVTILALSELCRSRNGWNLWATVHDEVLLEIPEDFTKEDIADIERVMVETYPWGDQVKNATDIE